MCLLLLFACFLAIPLINRKLKTDLLIWMGKQTGVAWIKVAIAWLAFMLISSTFALADVKMQFSKNMESFGHLAEAQRDFYMSLACFALFM
jgi:ABC-type tungstate transport system substrate-binding protein